MTKRMNTKKMQKIIVFACVALSPLPIANQKRSGFSASNAKAGLTKLALRVSFDTSVIIVGQIKF